MTARQERAGNLTASGYFWCGVALILTAPLMNFAYDRMVKARLSGDGSEMLPSLLAALYDTGGKMGVTLFLVSLGVTVLVVGHIWHNMKRRWIEVPSDSNDTAPQVRRRSSTDEQEEVVAPHGQMVLQTRKYLS